MGPAFWAEMPEVFAEARRRPRRPRDRAHRLGQELQLRPRPARDGRVAVRRDGRRLVGPTAGGLPRDDPAHAGCDQRRRRLPHPDHRLGARLVHRRRRGPDLGRRHPLRQRRREVLGARGEAGDRRRRRQPGPAAADPDRRPPARAGADGQGHRRRARREDRPRQRRLRRRRGLAGRRARDRRRDRRQPAADRQRHQGRARSAAHRPGLGEPALCGGVERGVPAVEGPRPKGITATFEKRTPNFTGE